MIISYIFLLIFIITVIVTLYRIQSGFSLIVAWRIIIPAVVRLGPGPGFIGTGNAGLSLNSCFTFLLIIVFTYKLLFKKTISTNSVYQKAIPFVKVSLIFILILFFIALFSAEQTIIDRIGSVFTFAYTEFLLAFIGWHIFTEKKDIKFFLKCMLISSIVISIYGFFCYSTLTNPYIMALNAIYKPTQDFLSFMDEDRAGLAGRIQGTMIHPLIWGGSCMLLSIFIAYKQYGHSIFIKLFQLLIIVLLALNALFSGSRSSLIGLIAGCITIFLFSKAKFKVRYFMFALLGFVALSIAISENKALSKYQPFFESTFFFWNDTQASKQGINGSSAGMRLRQLEGSIHMIDDSPLFGLGTGYIKWYSSIYGSHPLLQGFESIVFMALVETGFIGLLVWTWFFMSLYKIANNVKRRCNLSKFDSNVVMLKALVATYAIFILFTGLQSTLYLFLILYVLQVRLIFNKDSYPLTSVVMLNKDNKNTKLTHLQKA